LEIALFWLALSVVVGVAASSKGRSGVGWFLLAAIVSPLIAGLLILALPSRKPPTPQPVTIVPAAQATSSDLKKCPDCAEIVQADARICRFCRHEFQVPPAKGGWKEPDPTFRLPPV